LGGLMNPRSARDRFEWARRRPALWGIVSTLLVFGWGLYFGFSWPIAMAVAVPAGVANWFMWRRNGPGNRWRAALLRRDAARRERS
jgi:hypothetical protein